MKTLTITITTDLDGTDKIKMEFAPGLEFSEPDARREYVDKFLEALALSSDNVERLVTNSGEIRRNAPAFVD